MVNKVELHKGICEKLNETYRAKNADYGDSFARVRKEEGREIILARLKDKLYRLETLMHGAEQQVQDEKEEDTIIDFVNYGIMELVELMYDKAVKKESEKALFMLTYEVACKGCEENKKCNEAMCFGGCETFARKSEWLQEMVDKIKAGGEDD